MTLYYNATETIQSIDDIVNKLLEIKAKEGNIKVVDILWETADHQVNEIIPIRPTIYTNPKSKEKLVIFG